MGCSIVYWYHSKHLLAQNAIPTPLHQDICFCMKISKYLLYSASWIKGKPQIAYAFHRQEKAGRRFLSGVRMHNTNWNQQLLKTAIDQTEAQAADRRLIFTPWVLGQVFQSLSSNSVFPDFCRRGGQRRKSKKLSFRIGKSPETSMHALSGCFRRQTDHNMCRGMRNHAHKNQNTSINPKPRYRHKASYRM